MSEQVQKLIMDALEELSYDTSDLSGDMPLGPAGIDLESLTVAELAVRIQDELGVQIQEDELERVMTMTLDEFVAEVDARIASAEVSQSA